MQNQNIIKLTDMTDKEYDEYMCRVYPTMFIERNLPMSETCMCRGFDIGRGWRHLVTNACEKILVMEKTFHVTTVFKQVKQKLGGLRLYHNPTWIGTTSQPLNPSDTTVNTVFNLIDDIINYAQYRSYHICEGCETPISASIVSQGWIHARCERCFTDFITERKIDDSQKIIKEAIDRRDALLDLKWNIGKLTLEQIRTTNAHISTLEYPPK